MNNGYLPDGSIRLVPWTAAVVLAVSGCGVVAWQSRGDHVGRYAPAAPEVRTFGRSEFGPLLGPSGALAAADEPPPQSTRGQLISGGPRVGVTLVTGDGAKGLEAEYDAEPVLSLVGWHLEYQYETSVEGPTGIVVFVPFIAGMEQGLEMLIANLLFGLRTAGGVEFATGANYSSSGIGLTVAVGKTYRAGEMNLPIDLAIVSGKAGVRYSLTFGWNMRQ